MNAAFDPPPFSSVARLRLAIAGTERLYASGRGATVGQLIAPLGSEASALAATLLALPFLSPMSLGPLTWPACLLIVLLGWRLIREQERTSLPGRLLALPVPQALHRAMGAVLERVQRWVHRFSRPRHPYLVGGRRGRVVCGVGVIVGAVLLAVPIPLLPLTNTFPALGILCFGLGWAERDGLLTVVGAAALLVSVLIFAGIGAAVAVGGAEALQHALPWITS